MAKTIRNQQYTVPTLALMQPREQLNNVISYPLNLTETLSDQNELNEAHLESYWTVLNTTENIGYME